MTSTYDISQGRTNYMPMNESKSCISQWCQWNNLSFETAYNKIKEIVDRKAMKVDTLVIMGHSNTGKTLIATSIGDSFRRIGRFIPAQNAGFLFQAGIGIRTYGCTKNQSYWTHRKSCSSTTWKEKSSLFITRTKQQSSKNVCLTLLPAITSCGSWSQIQNYAKHSRTGAEHELAALRKKFQEQEEEIGELYDVQDKLEQYMRKNSLEIRSVPETADTKMEDIVLKLAEALDVPVEPKDIKICPKLNRKGNKPIIVKFISHKVKKTV